MFEYIVNHFNRQIDTAAINTESLTPMIAEAATLLASKLGQGCVFGVSSNQAFAAGFELNRLLLNLHSQQRPSLPSVSLNSNQFGHAQTIDSYAQALAHMLKHEDMLVIFSSSGEEKPLLALAELSQNNNVSCLYIGPNGSITKLLDQSSSQIIIPNMTANNLLQLQISLTHLLVELAEISLFGANIHE